VSPTVVTLGSSKKQQFSASIAGTKNQTVTWTLKPAVGSISPTGVYTAPANINVSDTITLTAISVQDPTKTATASISLAAPVSVTVSPAAVTLSPNQTQSFTANVQNSANTAVNWTLTSALGSISKTGVYTAPSTIATIQVVTAWATSVADPTKSGRATITLTPPVIVTVLPSNVTLTSSGTQQFNSYISGSTDKAVTWKLDGAVGSISASGLYSAPATLASAQTVTVTATSHANSSASTSSTIRLQPPPPTLRGLAAKSGILVGAAADADEYGQQSPLIHNASYATTLATQYNMLEGENAMKWSVIGAERGVYNFEPGDSLVAFAQANDMKVRGHNLCWWQQNPDWLSTLSSEELSTVLHDYIFTTMQHYEGKVFAWDVVNEAISNNATGIGTTLNDAVWYNKPGIGLSGTGYIEQAFRWARQADSTAKLFYNDHDIEVTGKKSEALLNMLRDFIARGVPIDGVGLEMHVDTAANYPATFPAVLQAYTDLGLEVHISELDVRIPVDKNGVASAANLQAQANTYKFIVETCLQNPRCTAIQTWGFSDAWSWIPSDFPGYGAALPFDKLYQPKPAYNSILDALHAVQR